MSDSNPRVAAVQMTTKLDVSANLQKAERLVREAASAGATLVVLPENFAFMGRRLQDVLGLRERDGDGWLQSFLSGTATRYGVWIVGGTIPLVVPMIPVGPAQPVWSLTSAGNGSPVTTRSTCSMSMSPVPMSGTRSPLSSSPARIASSSRAPAGGLGVAVCYDLRFPELFRILLQGRGAARRTCRLHATTGKTHWEILVRARAVENLAYVIAAVQGDYHVNGRETYGDNMIVDPWGAVPTRIPQYGLYPLSAGEGFPGLGAP